MSTKIAVVTGSNKGIGFGIVRGLCKRFKGIVYLTSRDIQRGEKAVAELRKEGLQPMYHQLDISDVKSVERFRDYIKEKYGGIDILVNNAAIMFLSGATESVAEQAKQTLFVNFFSVLSTCEILFPLLRNGARVVNLNSAAGFLNRIPSAQLRERLQNPNLTIPELSALMNQYIAAAKKGTQVADWGKSSYAVSKVGLIALTKIQQRLVSDRGIKVNAVDPGHVDTDMSEHKGPLTIDQGAASSLYLALDAPDSVRGEFVQVDNTVASWSG